MIRESHLNFLGSNNLRATQGSNDLKLTEEIFFNSIRKSHIGQISGKKNALNNTNLNNLDDILPPIEEEKKVAPPKRRINFSEYREIATSKIGGRGTSNIGKITGSRMQDIAEVSDYLEAEEANLFMDSEYPMIEETLIIKSFVGANQKNLLNGQSCFCCSKSQDPRCKLVLCNQSTVEIYVIGQSEEQKMQYNDLLFCVNFDTAEVELLYQPKFKDQEFAITVGEVYLRLKHQKPKVIQKYFKELSTMQKQCKGKELNITKLLGVDEFYKTRYETEQFFTKNCESGDIILFQDTHFCAKVQRFLTRSDFDHVAVAIKDVSLGLLLFQSMSNGVALTPWRSVIRCGWYQQIPRIVWRRLKVKRDQKFYSTVQNFVKQNLEKSYHISFAKLTAQQSMIYRPKKKQSQEAQKKEEQAKQGEAEGFFCSELVATLYKDLELLTRDTTNPNYMPACTFYPKDFSSRSGRKLDNGELSPEYDIFFDNKLLKLNYKNFKFD